MVILDIQNLTRKHHASALDQLPGRLEAVAQFGNVNRVDVFTEGKLARVGNDGVETLKRKLDGGNTAISMSGDAKFLEYFGKHCDTVQKFYVEKMNPHIGESGSSSLKPKLPSWFVACFSAWSRNVGEG